MLLDKTINIFLPEKARATGLKPFFAELFVCHISHNISFNNLLFLLWILVKVKTCQCSKCLFWLLVHDLVQMYK